MVRTFVPFLMLWSLAVGSASAWEPPRTSLGEALPGARLVIVGRVVETREIERRAPYHLKAEATLIAGECLLGMTCARGERLSLRYTVLSEMECDPGVELSIGTEYLFVFREPAPTTGPLKLVTCARGAGRDMAFQIGWGAGDLGEDEQRPVWSPWRGVRTSVLASMADLRAWLKLANRAPPAPPRSCGEAVEAFRTAWREAARCDRDEQCEMLYFGVPVEGCWILGNRGRTGDIIALGQAEAALVGASQRGLCRREPVVADCPAPPGPVSEGPAPFLCVDGRCARRR